MKLSQKQLRTLVESVLREMTDEYSEGDADNAQSAEYGLDMLHYYFQQDPADEAARQRVMQVLYRIQGEGTE